MSVSFLNQSCFDFLPTLASETVDLVLLDPPYNISRKTNFAAGEKKGKDTDRFRVSMQFGDWDNAFTGLDIVLTECGRILKPHGTIICFYDLWKISDIANCFEKAGFTQMRFVEWVKTNPVPLNSKTNYLTNAREIAITGVKSGRPCFNSQYDNGIYAYPICHDKGRFHPTQKPVALIEALIAKHSNPGDVVLDCFAGSGTTAVAATNIGRDFVGCEISEEFYQKACQRLQSLNIVLQK